VTTRISSIPEPTGWRGLLGNNVFQYSTAPHVNDFPHETFETAQPSAGALLSRPQVLGGCSKDGLIIMNANMPGGKPMTPSFSGKPRRRDFLTAAVVCRAPRVGMASVLRL
jgi:hypothetical protein